MLVLVTGGAASGKSELAERIACGLGKHRVYVATMAVRDQEDQMRVDRHRALREDKGFVTIECPAGLEKLSLEGRPVVLLECMTNLIANELFGGPGGQAAEKMVLAGVDRIMGLAESLVVVTGELFSDGISYTGETRRYLDILASVNKAAGERADAVLEAVCGIPMIYKGRELLPVDLA